jgi:RNA polymerase sigma-70 factor (ECF subfamily)
MPDVVPPHSEVDAAIAKAHKELTQRGDKSAFNDAAPIILLFCARVVAQAYPHLQTADRDNIAQESLIKVWRHLDTFIPSQKGCSWLMQIARNAAIDYMRRDSSRMQHVPIEIVLEGCNDHAFVSSDHGGNDPSKLLVEAEEAERFVVLQDTFLKSLSEAERVVALGRMEGLSYDEIAEKAGIPLGTVKSRLNAMRTRLKQRFENASSRTY